MEPDGFTVLAEPNRRRILDILRERERAVGELVDMLALSQPAVSKHLRVLRDAGFVDARVDAQRRVYRVRAEPLKAIDEWLKAGLQHFVLRIAHPFDTKELAGFLKARDS